MTNPKFQPYRSKKNGLWYWRVVGKNGKKICTGNESFKRRPSPKVLAMLIRNLTQALYDWKK